MINLRFPVSACFMLIALLSAPGWAAQTEPSAATFCYLPTESNVAYSDVLKQTTGSPVAVIPYADDPLQFGELWLPSNDSFDQKTAASSSHPLVVLIHGGCWLSAYDISHSHALSTALANSGYAVWAVEYRRSGNPGGGWPGSYHDILEAISHVNKLSEPRVDTEQVAIVGHSAGGHLALLAGADQSLNEQVNIAGVIGLAAIVDIESYALGTNSCQTATPQFMFGTPAEKPVAYAAANPANKVQHPNTLLLHGSLDNIVPLAQATTSGIEFQTIEGAGHFDMIHPSTQAFQALLKQLAVVFRGADQ